MTTQKDIINRLNKGGSALFDFFPEIAIGFLTFEQAKPFLNQEKLKEEGGAELEKTWTVAPITAESILPELKDYMEFAWGKVEDHRGLSASRSVSKMEAWCWLLGKEGEIDWNNYTNYGAPILKQVSELFSIPLPDNPKLLNMAKGESCTSDCEMGCGE